MKKEITWQAPEFVHYPKGPFWFASLTVVGAGLVVYFLFQKDFLTALLFLLLYIVVLYFSRTKAKVIEITLDAEGLSLNHRRVPFSRIKTFWIVYEPDVKTLNFETTAYLNRFLSLQLEDQDPSAIREFLSEYLPEDADRGEHISDKLSRTLKF